MDLIHIVHGECDHCRIGSLERNHYGNAYAYCDHCRIGSLENVRGAVNDFDT